MEFHCEDFPQFGVVLVPPSDPEYDRLLVDIERHVGPVDGRDGEFSAILINRSQHGIAAIQPMWTFEEVNGRTHRMSLAEGRIQPSFFPSGFPRSH
ncbi:MAG: hypothetical protein ABSF22_07925 [Bryobacteraceae bacterium]|jgi:hypothetical protein